MSVPRVLVALLALCASPAALGYPQFIASGYTNCATCHYSPTGGGLPNSYGHLAAEATFPDKVKVSWLRALREGALAKNDVLGLDDHDRPALQYDVGLDLRLMALETPTSAGGPPRWVGFPMLAEVGGVVAYGPVLAYATMTPRPLGLTPRAYALASREHWLQWKLTDEQSLRAGRLVLPFGIRVADHTAYTREHLGFNKYDQYYALQWDLYTERLMASAAAFDSTLISERIAPGQRGLAASIAYNLPGRASLGLSGLASLGGSTRRAAGSLFLRWRPLPKTYLMGELATVRVRNVESSRSQLEPLAMVRLGAFVADSADVYFEWGGRTVVGAWETTKLRYLLGVNWKVIPWVELSPAVLLEETVESGLSRTFLAQLHVFW